MLRRNESATQDVLTGPAGIFFLGTLAIVAIAVLIALAGPV